MDILVLIILFVFGAIVGSFLNVVILRYNTGKNLNGRSGCMSCRKVLAWYELVPIFSYFFLGGRCSKCKTKISIQYPIVELITGFLFVFTYMNLIPVNLLEYLKTFIGLLINCLLVTIAVYDIRHKIIPNIFVYLFSGIAFINMFIGQSAWFIFPSLNSLLAGPLLALPFASIWFFSKGKWMGLGDAKLVLGIGWYLGFGAGANSIILSFWIAAVISISWLLIVYRSIRPKTEIPFGPYLIIGMYIVLFYQIKVIDFDLVKEMIFSLF